MTYMQYAIAIGSAWMILVANIEYHIMVFIPAMRNEQIPVKIAVNLPFILIIFYLANVFSNNTTKCRCIYIWHWEQVDCISV